MFPTDHGPRSTRRNPTFVPSCVYCGKRGTEDCGDHGKNRPKHTSARIIRKRVEAPRFEPACADCGSKAQPRLHYKTDPRNFAEVRRLLCTPCAKAGGWAAYDFTRSMVGPSIGKQAA